MSRPLVPGSLAAAALLSACGGSDPLGPADLAGTYILVTVSGQPVPAAGTPSVLSGVIFLGQDGAAVRRVRYATAATPAGVEEVSAGTFLVRGDSVVLRMTLLSSRPPVAVQWAAARQGPTLSLRFGAPADGPDVVELYRRPDVVELSRGG